MILDLIKKYKETKAFLQTVHSSRRKLAAIIDFFKECELLNHYPPNPSFIIDFVPVLINIFKTTSVNFISPEFLESSKVILTLSKEYYKDEIVLSRIDSTLDCINMNLLKMYFYLGEYENGLVVLQSMVSGSSNFDEVKFSEPHDKKQKKDSKPRNISEYSVISKDFFKKPRSFEILEEIKYELDRLNSYSSDEINVLLVEETVSYGKENSFGLIQPLACDIIHENNNSSIFRFHNITDLSEDKIHNSFGNLQSSMKFLVRKFSKQIIKKNISINLHFNALNGIYKGSSFLLPALVISFCNYQKYINNICNFEINCSSVFSSSLDENGNLVKLPYDSLKAKINTAFFSWIKYVIIPKENISEAENILLELRVRYPKKDLNIIGIDNAEELFKYKEVIKIKRDTMYEHTKKVIKRNSTLSLTVFSVFVLLLGIFLALKIIPRDVKPLPKSEAEMYLIYAPDRDTNWIFKNENKFGGDTIDFGEVAVGDLWYPKMDFISNSRKKEEFKIESEGESKDEFEVLWRDEGNQKDAPLLNPDFAQRLYIKFRPTDINNLGTKKARLIFYSTSEPKNKKTIFVKGNSVRYKNGYSLLFDNPYKQLVLNNKQNILGDVFTIEFWMKPLQMPFAENSWVLNDEDGTNNKFDITVTNDSFIYVRIHKNKTSTNPDVLYANGKIICNQWNHFALMYKKGKISILLNDNIKNYNLKNNPIKNNPDRIYLGGTKGHEKRKLEVFDNNGVNFLLYGLKIWNSSLNPYDVLGNKESKKILSKDNLILNYDFDEMNFEAVYDLSKNDNWATIYSGINRKMDSPFNTIEKSKPSESGNTVLKLKGRGTTFCAKNIFDKNTSFTIQVDSKFNLKDTLLNKNVFCISHPDNAIEFLIRRSSINASYCHKVFNYIIEENKPHINDTLWHKYTLCYSAENNSIKIYLDKNEISSFDSLSYKYDVGRWFYGLSFGNNSFFYAPRYLSIETFIDNAKVFNRAITPSEIFTDTKNGLLAYWTFEKTDEELALDEVNNLPLLMWEDYKLVNEDISYLKK